MPTKNAAVRTYGVPAMCTAVCTIRAQRVLGQAAFHPDGIEKAIDQLLGAFDAGICRFVAVSPGHISHQISRGIPCVGRRAHRTLRVHSPKRRIFQEFEYEYRVLNPA